MEFQLIFKEKQISFCMEFQLNILAIARLVLICIFLYSSIVGYREVFDIGIDKILNTRKCKVINLYEEN
jgi:hypothetical protein